MNSRCEVCDDTNATIHCQECRRRTCEECDEILHLVDANKSHNRVPLFPSRGGSQVNSRGGSFAPTRNVSPRGLRRQEDAAQPAASNSAWPDSGHSKPGDSINYGVQAYDGNAIEYPQPSLQQPVQMAPQRQAPPPQQQQNEYLPPQQQQPPQRSQLPSVEPPKQPQYQPSNGYVQPYQPPQQAVQQPQYRQPQQAYGQARSGYATPSGGMVGGPGGARSGYATPTYSQYPVPRSMTHSGATTPTYGQTGQRYVSAGPVPYNQLPQNQAPRHPTYDQKPMLDQVNPQQQAYQQHVELIQQHRAVEAHQRLMAQRNDQARHSQQNFHHQSPNNTVQPAMVHPQRYTTSYVMSHHGSVVSSVAPSARNSPPMQPMQPRVPVPGLMHPEPAHQYRMSGDMGFARASWPHAQPQMNNMVYARLGQPTLQPVYGGYHQPLYSGASSVTRTPYNEPRFMNEPMSPSQYALPTNIAYPTRTPYNEPRTPYNEPRTPFNEPRTPLNEPQVMRTDVDPRSPANEPAWMDRQFMQAPNQIQRAGPQQIQRTGAPMPVRSAPEPPAYGRPMQQQSQPHNPQQQQLQQYGAPVHSYAPHQFPKVQQLSPQQVAPQKSAPMPPNNYSNYTPLEETGNGTQNQALAPSWSNRYDPDEAEARVRNLIADTERMLAGLSSLSGNKSQKPSASEGVSV